jgi:hypothetical protein
MLNLVNIEQVMRKNIEYRIFNIQYSISNKEQGRKNDELKVYELNIEQGISK